MAASWFQRSYGMDIIWPSVLTRGVAWDFKVYDPYTKEVYVHFHILLTILSFLSYPCRYEDKFKVQIAQYKTLMDRVPSLAVDREVLRKDSSAIELLGASVCMNFLKHEICLIHHQMVDSANQARSNDISSLKDKFLQYLGLELPVGSKIPNQPNKSDRGFRNQYTAQLLIPAVLRSQFDENPDE